jgi:hypothetical protein
VPNEADTREETRGTDQEQDQDPSDDRPEGIVPDDVSLASEGTYDSPGEKERRDE